VTCNTKFARTSFRSLYSTNNWRACVIRGVNRSCSFATPLLTLERLRSDSIDNQIGNLWKKERKKERKGKLRCKQGCPLNWLVGAEAGHQKKCLEAKASRFSANWVSPWKGPWLCCVIKDSWQNTISRVPSKSARLTSWLSARQISHSAGRFLSWYKSAGDFASWQRLIS
jgi:hypothetical protein